MTSYKSKIKITVKLVNQSNSSAAAESRWESTYRYTCNMATTIEMDASSQQATAFTSIMPVLDDLLDLIGKQATADEIGGGSNDDIVKKVGRYWTSRLDFGWTDNQAKELRSRMEEMKRAAIELPGGHISLDQAVELEGMLDLETEKRR
jgi:hypothetical protein